MCQCTPTSNLTCEYISPFMIAQPMCQALPDGTTNVNPYYDETANMTYYTYNLYNVCTGSSETLDVLALVITKDITQSNLTVSELIMSCGRFESVAYTLTNPGRIFVNLSIPIDGRYTTGAAVYRLEIIGEFLPTISRLILVTSDRAFFTNAEYQIPRDKV